MRGLRAANSLLCSKAAASRLPRTAPGRVRIAPPERSRPPAPQGFGVGSARSSGDYGPWHAPVARPFSHTARAQKRKKNNNSNNNNDSGNGSQASSTNDDGTGTGTGAGAGAEDPSPFDFSDLTSAFERAEKRFTEELRKLRTGGRFNADTIGSIPVQLDRKSAQTFPLRELATVAPVGGRRWSILAFEESSVKPIASAVQRSDEFNQQPQRSAENPLELTMTVEPERADALARRARQVCQDWRTRVRDEAHRRAELHKRWRAERRILSDDLHLLKRDLQKLQDAAMKVIQAKEKEAVQLIMAKAS